MRLPALYLRFAASCLGWVGLLAISQSASTSTLDVRGQEVALLHPPLEHPATLPASAAQAMQDDDVVVGVVLDDRQRAYPWWVLKNFHCVNDRLGDEEILVAFCEQCSAGTAFSRRLGDRLLSFETEGVTKGTILLRDRETESRWAPFEGRALEGPLEGEELERIPTHLTHWGDWKRRHPGTDVVVVEASLRSGHGARERPGGWGVVAEMGSTLDTWDPRLPENEFVYGLDAGDLDRAYPLERVRLGGGVVNDTLGDLHVLVLARGDFEMAGFDRRLDGRLLEFEGHDVPDAVARDLTTSSTWNIEGRAITGPLAGRRLQPLDGYSVEWHVWSDYHPATEIWGRRSEAVPESFPLPLSGLPRLVGESLEPESFHFEKLTVLVIWAHWCPPCREKLPLLKDLHERSRRGELGFATLTVQIGDPAELSGLKNFVYEHEIAWPIFLFEDATYEQLDSALRRHRGEGILLPSALLVDRRGWVIDSVGPADWSELDARIATARGATPPAK